jgi:nucleotide-binding universal stress UspA family protein
MAQLIVPLDGSELARRVLPLAAALARAGGHHVEFVHALEFPRDEAPEFGLRFDPLDDLEFDDDVRFFAERYDVAASTTLASGRPSEVILEQAGRPGARAVVMATHGRSGVKRAFLGSVAEQVLRAARIPVFLLPAKAPEPADAWQPRRIIVPLDGSPLSEAVLPAAGQLARDFGAQIILLRAYPMPDDIAVDPADNFLLPIDTQVQHLRDEARHYFQPLLSALTSLSVSSRAEPAFGEPVEAILEAVNRMNGDLILMATHGRSGLNRLFGGSVAEGVLRRSHAPLMMLGQAALRRPRQQQDEAVTTKEPVAA